MSNEQTPATHHSDTLPFFIGDKEFKWSHQYITGRELRTLAQIPEDWSILLAIKRPWDDEVIENDTSVDLAREGIERFIIRKPYDHVMVEIFINGSPYEIKRGKHSVAQLKHIGGVPVGYELEELIDGQLTPLDDHATVRIKGCEKFFGHVRDGSSS
jgi:hypothetical protein